MILQDKNTDVEQIGQLSEQAEFSIKASKKAFQILSGMYSDLPLAIVRELVANGWDSHIAANKKDVPVHIHLPNALEPWLTIQDFGTGISHKDIYEIYTKYFESTKTNTNEQAGCFGLGSKVQMAYTDSFISISITDGVKRTYNVFFNANGVPCISLVSQENTNESNGLSVQIPIKSNDFEKFQNATYRACRYYEVKPNITGGKIDWNIDKPNFVGSFWRSFTSLNQSYALMGNVAYPINIYQLSYENQDIARKAGLVINFNLGELEITPSREDLTYSDFTIKSLNDKIELVKLDFAKNVEDTIKTSPNLLDAMMALWKLKNDWSFLNSAMINGKVHWNKVEITEPRSSIQKIAPTLVSYSKNRWGRKKYSESGFAALHNNAVWYVNDLPKGCQKRVIHFIRFNQNADIAINVVEKKEMDALVKAGFPSSIFIQTSTLPAIVVNRGTGGKNSKPKGVINLYSPDGYSYRQSWESESFDLAIDKAPQYYVVKDKEGWSFNGGNLKDSDGNVLFHPTGKDGLKKICEFLGIKNEDVKMVSTNNAKHIEALGSSPLKDLVNSKTIKLDKEKIAILKSINQHTIKNVLKHKDYNKLSANNPFKIFIEELKDVMQYQNPLKNLSEYCNIQKKDLTFPSKMVELLHTSLDSWQAGIDLTLNAAVELN